LCLLLPLLILFGCAASQKTDGGKRYYVDEEELMVAYTPRDDGLPLTPAELHAFKTVTAFDRYLSEEDARIVELQFKYFVHQHRRSFERFLERSARFLPYVRKEFENRGIPEELVYVFMIESGGNPNARSRAGAVGLWQFMPRTGRHYRLFQNAWIDERRDPYKATIAAADYLLKLYNDFGDWHLVAAAYNAGEGKIGRALSGTGAGDFFELNRLNDNLEYRAQLRKETRDYVPRLIAVAKIMRNLERLGFSEPDPALAWDLQPLILPPSTNLTALARDLDLSWEEFSGMNPAYRRTASPPNMDTTAYVPPDKRENAVAFVQSREARVSPDGRTHTVQKGDTLASIARRHKTSIAAIREANGFDQLPAIGAVIIIPGRGTAGAAGPAVAGSNYTVHSGDTLNSLARQWGVSVNAIRAENGMGANDTNLRAGQRLLIPGGARPASAPLPRKESAAPSATAPLAKASGGSAVPGPASGMTYTVQQGDTLFSIARNNGVSVGALQKANNMGSNTNLRVGQRLVIPSGP